MRTPMHTVPFGNVPDRRCTVETRAAACHSLQPKSIELISQRLQRLPLMLQQSDRRNCCNSHALHCNGARGNGAPFLHRHRRSDHHHAPIGWTVASSNSLRLDRISEVSTGVASARLRAFSSIQLASCRRFCDLRVKVDGQRSPTAAGRVRFGCL